MSDISELDEFKTEALELIEGAEKDLLEVESGQAFTPRYDAIFRCLHSLKGAAGMLGLEDLRKHMHHLEDLFGGFKKATTLSPLEITFFLEGIDASKKIVSGQKVEFKFELPMMKVSVEKSESKKVDIFIIDDEEDLVEILGGYMTKCKLTWQGFTDSEKAVEELKINPPSLVISDLNMPRLDGMAVLTKLRDISQDIPFVIISAQLSKETLIQAISQGISGVIEKPFREGQVVDQVTHILYQAELNELLNSTIELLMFQMQDLEDFLTKSNKVDILNMLKKDVTQLLMKRRKLKQMSTKRLGQ